MKKLVFEREETLPGSIIYWINFGGKYLFRIETKDDDELIEETGHTAREIAQQKYDEYLNKIKQGYPKITVLAEHSVIEPSN